MTRIIRRMLLPALAVLAVGPTISYAEELNDCQDQMLWECYQAMKGRNFFIRWGAGLGCTVGLALCTFVPDSRLG